MNPIIKHLKFIYVNCTRKSETPNTGSEEPAKDYLLDFRDAGNLNSSDLGLIVRFSSAALKTNKTVRVVAQTEQKTYIESKLKPVGFQIYEQLETLLEFYSTSQNTTKDIEITKRMIDQLRKPKH